MSSIWALCYVIVAVLGFTPVFASECTPGSNLTGARWVGAGNGYGCATFVDNTIRCWRSGNDGHLGNNHTNRWESPDRTGAVEVVGIDGKVLQLAVSSGHACVILALAGTQHVKCWGHNTWGQTGSNAFYDTVVPVRVSFPDSQVFPVKVSVGNGKSCAILSDETVRCWGSTTSSPADPTKGDTYAVPLDLSATDIDVGSSFYTCAILSDQTIRCWGSHDLNQSEVHVHQPPVVGVVQLSVDEYYGSFTACVILSGESSVDGLPATQCWTPLTSEAMWQSVAPLNITNITFAPGVFAKKVSCGGWICCAILSNNRTECWEDEHPFVSLVPIPLLTGIPWKPHEIVFGSFLNDYGMLSELRVINLDVGSDHACAVVTDESIRCWGFNYNGELGMNFRYWAWLYPTDPVQCYQAHPDSRLSPTPSSTPPPTPSSTPQPTRVQFTTLADTSVDLKVAGATVTQAPGGFPGGTHVSVELRDVSMQYDTTAMVVASKSMVLEISNLPLLPITLTMDIVPPVDRVAARRLLQKAFFQPPVAQQVVMHQHDAVTEMWVPMQNHSYNGATGQASSTIAPTELHPGQYTYYFACFIISQKEITSLPPSGLILGLSLGGIFFLLVMWISVVVFCNGGQNYASQLESHKYSKLPHIMF